MNRIIRSRSILPTFVASFALVASVAACQPEQLPADVVQTGDSGRTDAGSHDTGSIDAPATSDVAGDTAPGTDVATGTDVVTGTDVAMHMDVVTGSDAGRDAGCSAPSTLHPPSTDAGTRTLYCPFSSTDGGTNAYCDPTAEHCCEPTSGTASCVATATACAAGNTDWQCADPVADCPAGSVCCGSGTLMLSADPACGNFASGFHGTHCATSCTGMEIRMCTADSECPSGQTCHPFRAKGNQVGGCM